MYDVIIAGGGPAGMTAAIYAARGGLETLLLERAFAGGQMAISAVIENYPGFELDVAGADIAQKMKLQAERMGAEVKTEGVTGFSLAGPVKKVVTRKGEYEAKTVILAMGATPRFLEIKGEAEFNGAGVSYCATCDGALFKGKDVAVIGGGNTAVEDALYLSKMCGKVYIVHRRDKFRAQSALVALAKKNEKIEFVMEHIPKEIAGEFAVGKVVLENVKTGEPKELDVSGVFVAVGQTPKSELVKDMVEVDENGYIVAGEDCATGVEGVFCAGDIRTKRLRQIVTATADGAVAAAMAEGYLIEY